MLVFLLQVFTCNYLPAVQYTVGRERYIIFQFTSLFVKVIKHCPCFATCGEVKNG